MESPPDTGQVLVERRYDDAHHVLFATAQFQPLFESYMEHARRWGVEPDPLGEVMMRQGLAALALHIACRPRDEQCGWTFNFKEPALNLFLAGKAHASTVAGRVYTEGVKTFDSSRLFVQVSRPAQDRSETVIDFEGLDVLNVFEEYYRRSEQHPARFFEYDESTREGAPGTFLLALGLPGVGLEFLLQLDRERAMQHMEGLGNLLDSRSFNFGCGCTTQRMKEVVQLVYDKSPESVFEGEDSIEVQCPRCGHLWILTRQEMDAAPE